MFNSSFAREMTDYLELRTAVLSASSVSNDRRVLLLLDQYLVISGFQGKELTEDILSAWSKTLSGKIFVHFLACSILCMLRHRIHTAEAKGIKLPFDSVPKMLASLSNITQTIFPDGGYFSEIVGKKKELLEGLEIPFPETEMDIEYEEDIAAEAEENLD